jgi:hypothetical protein
MASSPPPLQRFQPFLERITAKLPEQRFASALAA